MLYKDISEVFIMEKSKRYVIKASLTKKIIKITVTQIIIMALCFAAGAALCYFTSSKASASELYSLGALIVAGAASGIIFSNKNQFGGLIISSVSLSVALIAAGLILSFGHVSFKLPMNLICYNLVLYVTALLCRPRSNKSHRRKR